MIKIMKASAGSGKTYTLANEYIDMLLSEKTEGENPVWDEFAYRGILAVTFTNKATDEMKNRILKELYERAKKKNDKKAEKALHNILHDYSAFAVSTIDKFFQQTLRAFARELGQYAYYQVELDKDMVTNQAVDTILDSLDKNDKEDLRLADFILEHMEQKVTSGKVYDIEGGLKSMAQSLKSESFTVKAKELGMDPTLSYSQDELLKLKKSCLKERSLFEEQAKKLAGDIMAAISSIGLTLEDFNGGKRSWMFWIDKIINTDTRKKDLDIYTDNFRKKAENPDEWFSKANACHMMEAVPAIKTPLAVLLDFWDANFKKYNTAGKILENIYGLGIASRLFKVFEQLMNEKNLVCLDESNYLLKEIIAGSDAPFVYEKVGTRIKHYLLDEFQDTSVTQWENFLPLLNESNSHDSGPEKVHNLIVGDVKQSIYRWRESDWNLLDNVVQTQFPEAHIESMKKNYRSCSEIVYFNNALYPFIAQNLDADVPAGFRKISDIYMDVKQEVGKTEHDGRGYVKLKFVESAEEEAPAVLEMVKELHDNGMPYSDIAILVRTNESGTVVAQSLIDAGISVVTESSLRIANSVSVRRLVSLMSYADNPSNTINGYLARSFKLEELPSSYHSLTGLCDSLYAFLCRDEECRKACENEVMYVTAFADIVLDFSLREGNNLHAFLEYWQEKCGKLTISSPLGGDAVKVLSIHKSKGLDFPFVIVPFIEGISLYNATRTSMWCAPDLEAGELSGASGKLFHIGLSSASLLTCFDKSYEKEKYSQMVDAINLLYVATTRASQGMMLLGCTQKSSGNVVGLLKAFAGSDKEYGSKNFIHKADTQNREEETAEIRYSIFDLAGRLSVRPYAEEFFTQEDESFDGMSFRRKGIVFHEILGRTRFASDLEKSVKEAVDNGLLSVSDTDKVMKFLAGRVGSHPEIFPDENSCVKILMEKSIVNSAGEERRPDRVLIYPDGKVRIFDYKFGSPKDEYLEQIEDYKKIFLSLGFSDVEAVLWFVYQNKIQ